MARIARFWRHELLIERLGGDSPLGPVFAAPETVKGWVNDRRRLVRDESGTEVTSETTVYLPIGTPSVPTGSRVTLPPAFDGRSSVVITSSRHDSAGLHRGRADHLELALE